MPDVQWLQVGAALAGGGAVGAIITALVTARRGRIQPVGRRVEILPIFTKGMEGSALRATVAINDGERSHLFPNLFIVTVQLVNRGNQDIPDFSFGITLAGGDECVHV